MGQQEVREARMKEDAARQEQKFRALQQQFQLLQDEVQTLTNPVPSLPAESEPLESEAYDRPPAQARAPSSLENAHPADAFSGQSRFSLEPKLGKLTENDDVEHFLITFERIAVACRWPKSDWAFRLIPLLTGEARSAYVHMDIDESLDYEKVKSAILTKYDINPETYRQRFRSLEVKPGESPKELYCRLKELFGKWTQPKGKTVQEISEILILEQYLRMLSPELQVWIREHGPSSASEAAALADVFVAARKKSQPWSYNSWKAGKEARRPAPPQNHQRPAAGVGKPSMRDNQPTNVSSKPPNRVTICYLCGQEGHTKPMCPKNPSKLTQMCLVPHCRAEPKKEAEQSIKIASVEVNGKELKALVDTGSDQTLVHREFVPPNIICTLDTIPICCVHGDEKSYPTADMYITVQGQAYLLNIGVADNLPFPVVLGRDLPVLFDLLNPGQKCNVAVTRARVKQPDEPSLTLSTLPFYGAELETKPGKSRKPRSQKRQEKFKGTVVKTPVEAAPELPLGFELPNNVIELQQSDSSLTTFLQRAKEKETKADTSTEEYFLQNGILYRQHGPVAQLVVPQAARDAVLTLGHAVPWAGHLGKHKTTARIKRYFHWPGLRSDVAQFCRSCPQCQKTSAKCPSRAPLQPLPIIGTPFERLGMDIVGPVERSRAGNRFMLVITDYATKYPEVFPLKSIKARHIAFCLVQFFSRVGFPREILTDQGTNFMSTLLKQVYQLLGIKGLRTTPYHPQTDGLTERFNQTLKQMLRKFVNETGSDWDQWLPYLLFAYREVPQASTGFSPFELLYGHEVRGPLSLLREIWEGDQGRVGPVNIVSYVVQMRERLERMNELAQAYMVEAQQRQKAWYDRSARQRSFSPGQKVLVMLPTEDNK
uniref:Gypsy retrotransposon integrase-like protein 1 n=1 Tax=Myripristis murdjan TaxID=586833 RepID=A0A667YIB5_9TELE